MSAWGEPGRGYPRSRKPRWTTVDVFVAVLALLVALDAVVGILAIVRAGLHL